MPLNLAMWIMTGAELALWTLLALLFWRKRLQVRFPALGIYLALHVVSTPLLLIALWIQSQPWGYEYYPVYYYLYWLVYISSAVLLYFVCTEIFRASLVAFPGLMRFGVVIFRWMALASLIVTISTISFKQPGTLVVTSIAYALMRAVSILELCLLAFLCLSMNALQMTVRDMAFGVALSFGMMSANDFIQSSLLSIYSTLTAPLQFFYQSGILCSLGVWAVYLALP